MKPNKKQAALLRKVRDHILAEPKRMDMCDFLYNLPPEDGGPACGTVACIAGWMAKLAYPQKQISAANAEKIAYELLGFLRYDPLAEELPSDVLFCDWYWPEPFRNRLLNQRCGTTKYARVVAARIDHYIRTGE